MGLVQLKGGRGGVRLVLGPHADPGRIGSEIGRTLEGAAEFLGRTKISVEIADEPLTPALAQAIAQSFERFPRLTLAAITGARAPQPAPTRKEPRVLHRTVRSGQEVLHQGDLVILGDVHVGGRVIATGDVIVVGALRGLAWAGAEGDEGAIIYAQPLQPLQLRIAGVIAQGGQDGGRGDDGRREYAHLEAQRIVVEPWLPKSPRQGPPRLKNS